VRVSSIANVIAFSRSGRFSVTSIVWSRRSTRTSGMRPPRTLRRGEATTVAAVDGSRYGSDVRPAPYRELEGLSLDLGNTLLAMDAELVCEVLGAEGAPCAPEAFRRAEAAARPGLSAWIAAPASSEPTTLVYLREILGRLGMADGAATPLAARLLERVRGVPTERLWSSVLPGVPAALAELRAAGLRLVVVSNSDGTAEKGLVASGLRDLVDAVVDSAVFGAEKPDRRIFLHALGLLGVRPERAAHVGDLYAVDVLGARGAALHPVLLDPYGDWEAPDCEVAPDVAAVAARIASARA
jgi:putative hydrolase of the HAD superfamily